MPTLLDYRRRIRSVRNTQQITRAMKFISAALLRKSQDGVFAAGRTPRKFSAYCDRRSRAWKIRRTR
jgi:F0F1-type ATP synthase gamma subunit